jgi:hypothetical protein
MIWQVEAAVIPAPISQTRLQCNWAAVHDDEPLNRARFFVALEADKNNNHNANYGGFKLHMVAKKNLLYPSFNSSACLEYGAKPLSSDWLLLRKRST